MSALHSTKVTDGSIEGLQGAEHRRRQPTNGRQGKRPALRAAYVVGWISEFVHFIDTPRWRMRQFSERNQRSKRRRSPSRGDFGP